MGQHWNEEGFKQYRSSIIETNKEIKNTFERAYRFIKASKLIHDDWSNFNKTALDYSKILLLEDDLKDKIFSNSLSKALGSDRHIFATAFTPNGIVTFIENLSENCNKIYVLNGGPGTGKTQVLTFLYKEALRRGLFVEVYHDPLIPDRIEHIIIPELKTAIITSNEINKQKFTGTQIFMDNFVDYSKVNKDELLQSKENFNNLLNKGLSIISSAKKLHDELEKYYICNMNFKEIDETYELLLNRLLKY